MTEGAESLQAVGGNTSIKLAELTLASAQAVLEIGSIAAGFRALEVHFQTWGVTSNAGDGLRAYFNGDRGNNYEGQDWYAVGTTVGGGRYTQTQAILGDHATSLLYMSSGVLTIHNYDKTDRYKHWISQMGGYYSGGQGCLTNTGSGYWKNTAALDRIALFSGNGSNLGAGSSMAIYGVR